MDIREITDILAISTGILLGIHFLTSSNNKKSNKYIGLFLLLFSMEITMSFIENDFEEIFFFLYVIIPNPFIYYPFLLFYVKQQTQKEKLNLRKRFLWFVPAILFSFFNLFIDDLFSDFANYTSYIFSFLVLFSILKLIKTNNKNLKNYYSNIQLKTLKWLSIITYILIGFNLIWILEDILDVFWEDNFISGIIAEFSAFATFITIYWIGFNSLRQPQIFSENLILPEEKQETSNKKSNIENSKEENILPEIIDKIRNNKSYKNQNLSLRDLSFELNIKEKQLSFLINNYSNKNFYAFINDFRFDEFERLAKENNNLSIEGLAYEAGFKSKSSFYTFCKNKTGKTPKDFINNILQV